MDIRVNELDRALIQEKREDIIRMANVSKLSNSIRDCWLSTPNPTSLSYLEHLFYLADAARFGYVTNF